MKAFELLKKSTPTISVGILTANLMKLEEELVLLDNTGVELLHFDVMDGCFCPMTTIGPPFIKGVKTDLLKDVHLMIDNPQPKLGDHVSAGADIVTVQLESDPRHIHRALQALGKMENANDSGRGLVRGIAVNPGTPIDYIEPLLGEIDIITLLAINPGWGGQRFISSTKNKLKRARKIIEASGQEILLCLDGGITKENIVEVAGMHPDIVVTGSAVFDGKSPKENAQFMIGALKGV